VPPLACQAALITGITGQDGRHLAERLVEKCHMVHGIKQRASSSTQPGSITSTKIPSKIIRALPCNYGDLTDSSNLIRIIWQMQPNEIYNLGAQTHEAVNIEAPAYTATPTTSAHCGCWRRCG
jgi:GDPmannose 4,6-dehydratase